MEYKVSELFFVKEDEGVWSTLTPFGKYVVDFQQGYKDPYRSKLDNDHEEFCDFSETPEEAYGKCQKDFRDRIEDTLRYIDSVSTKGTNNES